MLRTYEIWKNGPPGPHAMDPRDRAYGTVVETIVVDEQSTDDYVNGNAAACARAFELGGLAYERRVGPVGPWWESAHRSFPCREVDEATVEFDTPIGSFRIAARRVRAGDVKTCHVIGPGMHAYGQVATKDQISLPVRIAGRLIEPDRHDGWMYQPSHFDYEDGTSSDYLGSYPRHVELVPRATT